MLPLEFGNVPKVEAVARRRSIEFERICEPMKGIRLPRHLQAEGGNCKRGLLRRNKQIDDKRGAVGAIDGAALHHAARLANVISDPFCVIAPLADTFNQQTVTKSVR